MDIFSKIAAGEIPSYKCAESEKFYAFLDINPVVQAHTLVIPRREVDYIFDMEDDELAEFEVFAKRVAKAIRTAFPCKKVAQVVLGLEVPHAHIHLLPINSEGDLSENAEYDAAKEAQAHLETKINQLKLAIAEAKVIDTSRLSTEAVQILSTVEMTNMANNTKMRYTIVSENEANIKVGKISIKTPIAQGLLNKKVGDVVEIAIPRGTIKLRIDKITLE